MHNTKVKDLMNTDPSIIAPEASLEKAAREMDAIDCGFLPVGKDGKIVGIITDRDIVIRAIAKGKSPSFSKVKDFMSKTVYGCNEEDYLEDAAEKMRENKVSRLIVRDAKGQVTGILSFGGILRRQANPDEVALVVKHAIHTIV